MEQIKNKLIASSEAVEEYIYSLEKEQQDQIFNESTEVTEPSLLFLKNCYINLNDLIAACNKL